MPSAHRAQADRCCPLRLPRTSPSHPWPCPSPGTTALFVLILTIVPKDEGGARVYAGIGALQVALLLQITRRPFLSKTVNALEFLALLGTFTTLFIGQVRCTDRECLLPPPPTRSDVLLLIPPLLPPSSPAHYANSLRHRA